MDRERLLIFRARPGGSEVCGGAAVSRGLSPDGEAPTASVAAASGPARSCGSCPRPPVRGSGGGGGGRALLLVLPLSLSCRLALQALCLATDLLIRVPTSGPWEPSIWDLSLKARSLLTGRTWLL